MKIGVVLKIDKGVIGMVKAKIIDFVNVDDIFKVFRVTPKIVDVEEIVSIYIISFYYRFNLYFSK